MAMALWSRLFPRRSPSLAPGPSAAAIEAASAYYRGLYQDAAPDPVLFAQLIAEHGAPDWPNPYPLSEPEHYCFHPDGFVFADLEAVILDLLRERADQIPEDQVEDLPAIAAAARDQAADHDAFTQQCAKNARHCWALLLASKQPLTRLSSIVHPDNLWLVNMDILREALEGTWPDVDPARVAEGMRQFVAS